DPGTCADWTDYWNFYKNGGNGHSDDTGHTINTSGWDGHTLMAPFYDTQGGLYTFAGYSSYFLHLRSALAIAVRRQILGARASYNYLHSELSTTLPQQYRVGG